MVTYTTSTIAVKIAAGITLETADIYGTLTQGDIEVTKKHLVPDENRYVYLTFSQEETARFHTGTAIGMLNFYYEDGTRVPSTEFEVTVKENRYKRVIKNGS